LAQQKALDATFRPEFRNRLDAIVPFSHLSRDVMPKVVDKSIFALEQLVNDKGYHLQLTHAARSWLAEKGYDRKMGARPLDRVIEQYVKRPLADVILFDDLSKSTELRVDVDASGEQLVVISSATSTSKMKNLAGVS
jgi:ATP-dependent Clp protease ATP-binding subunit ClpA